MFKMLQSLITSFMDSGKCCCKRILHSKNMLHEIQELTSCKTMLHLEKCCPKSTSLNLLEKNIAINGSMIVLPGSTIAQK
jgi:hypothetical protein